MVKNQSPSSVEFMRLNVIHPDFIYMRRECEKCTHINPKQKVTMKEIFQFFITGIGLRCYHCGMSPDREKAIETFAQVFKKPEKVS